MLFYLWLFQRKPFMTIRSDSSFTCLIIIWGVRLRVLISRASRLGFTVVFSDVSCANIAGVQSRWTKWNERFFLIHNFNEFVSTSQLVRGEVARVSRKFLFMVSSMQPKTMGMISFSSEPLGLKGTTLHRLVWVSQICYDYTFTRQVHCPVTVSGWLMPTHLKLCKSNWAPSCSTVRLCMWGGSSAYNLVIWPSCRNLSSKWQERLLDNQSSYFQQRDIVHFVRQCLYSLSPHWDVCHAG